MYMERYVYYIRCIFLISPVLLKDLQQLACSGVIPPEHQAEVERVKAFLKE